MKAMHRIVVKYKNGMVGNCKFSDITVFSFHPVDKITNMMRFIAIVTNKRISYFNKLKFIN